MKLDKEQAIDLAKRLRASGIAVGNYYDEHFFDLSNARRVQLETLERQLLMAATDARTQAVGAILDETETSLRQLRKATSDAAKALKKLEQVRGVIKIATAVVKLSGAIVSKNPGAIADSVTELGQTVAAEVAA